jgi:hypothetical protein
MRSLIFLVFVSAALGSFQCERDNCGVCVPASWKRVHFSGDVCLNITYFPATLTLALDMTLVNNLDNKTIVVFNKTVSASNPSVCFGVPYLHKLASLCLDFSNVTFSSAGVSGCARVELKILGIDIDGVGLGCFDIHTWSPAVIGQAPAIVHSDKKAQLTNQKNQNQPQNQKKRQILIPN